MSPRFIAPMTIAAELPKDWSPRELWYAEEKYDGHRLCVAVSPDARDLFGKPEISAWSREGNPRDLPEKIVRELACLPSGVYDGELVASGGRRSSSDVVSLREFEGLNLILFDVIEYIGATLIHHGLTRRRGVLEEAFRRGAGVLGHSVRLAFQYEVGSLETLNEIKAQVLARGGEGLIVKNPKSVYLPGKRSKEWFKVKEKKTAVIRITGYVPGRGAFNYGDPCASVLGTCRETGITTSVKTRNEQERCKMEEDQARYIGRELRIEFQDYIRDEAGKPISFRHPRWDRWEDE